MDKKGKVARAVLEAKCSPTSPLKEIPTAAEAINKN
jgi:hypothetical protein